MTARRSSATERRGIPLSRRRPTAMLLALSAAAAVAAGAAGCASRQSSTGQLVGKTLPGNQDTAAVQQQLAAPPTTPPGQATPYGHLAPPGNPQNNGHEQPLVSLTSPFTTAPTSFPPPATYATDQAAWQAMGADVVLKTPPLHASPSVNPADPKPRLEIITMPMWLWVDPVIEEAVVPQATGPAHTVRVRTAVDTAAWSLDTGGSINCGGPTPAVGHGAGTPYVTAMDPTNPPTSIPACITYAPNSPQYTTDTSGPTPVVGAATRYYTAAVTWHAEYQIYDGTAWSAWTTTGVAPVAAPGTGQAPLQFRVGEIQALVTGP